MHREKKKYFRIKKKTVAAPIKRNKKKKFIKHVKCTQ